MMDDGWRWYGKGKGGWTGNALEFLGVFNGDHE